MEFRGLSIESNRSTEIEPAGQQRRYKQGKKPREFDKMKSRNVRGRGPTPYDMSVRITVGTNHLPWIVKRKNNKTVLEWPKRTWNTMCTPFKHHSSFRPSLIGIESLDSPRVLRGMKAFSARQRRRRANWPKIRELRFFESFSRFTDHRTVERSSSCK